MSGKVTWEKVIEAVIAYPVLNWRVAKEIAEKHNIDITLLRSKEEL